MYYKIYLKNKDINVIPDPAFGPGHKLDSEKLNLLDRLSKARRVLGIHYFGRNLIHLGDPDEMTGQPKKCKINSRQLILLRSSAVSKVGQ